MSDEHDSVGGGDEAIEDLEAPAAAQHDVVGGQGCVPPTCDGPTSVIVVGKCTQTTWGCEGETHVVVLHEQ